MDEALEKQQEEQLEEECMKSCMARTRDRSPEHVAEMEKGGNYVLTERKLRDVFGKLQLFRTSITLSI